MESGQTERLTLRSDKISGDGDREKLESALNAVDGVRNVSVNTDGHVAEVEYDPTIVDAEKVRAQAEGAGYPLSDHSDRGEADSFLESDTGAEDRSFPGFGTLTR